jgi:ribonucleotide monophosphatase NagD (HAD superfamily)
MGVPAEGDVVTSAQAAARLVQRGERVLLAGGPGAAEELERRGATIVPTASIDDGATVDVVVVGFHRTFDYEELRRAATAVRRGARLIGTNDDATYPTPDGPIPGGGSILASVAVGAGVAQPVVAGKPYAPMAAVVKEVLGGLPAVVVGDRPDTDGRFATELGVPFALVLSGVTGPADVDHVQPVPALVGGDLAALVPQLR